MPPRRTKPHHKDDEMFFRLSITLDTPSDTGRSARLAARGHTLPTHGFARRTLNPLGAPDSI
jgi:hypothetical protein